MHTFSHTRLSAFDLPPNKYLNDDGATLVGALATLDAKKRALKVEIVMIEEEEEMIKEVAIDLAMREGVTRFVGSDCQLTIKEEIDVVYPDSKASERADFEAVLKELGLWDQVSGFVASTFRALARNQWQREGIPAKVADYVKLEPRKTARLSRRKDEEPVR